ncbi:hypothetical protein AGIG_G22831 [Arapaima gigas]
MAATQLRAAGGEADRAIPQEWTRSLCRCSSPGSFWKVKRRLWISHGVGAPGMGVFIISRRKTQRRSEGLSFLKLSLSPSGSIQPCVGNTSERLACSNRGRSGEEELVI